MDIANYLLGSSSSAVVRDLIGVHGQDVEILFLVESPHSDELDRRHPLAGIAGADALAVLESRPRNSMSLGALVKQRTMAGDGRLAIVNISTVPLQAEAFKSSQRVPTSPTIDWASLVELREHAQDPTLPWSQQAQDAQKVLLDDVQRRIDAVQLGPSSLVAVCGHFAAMFGIAWRLPSQNILRLPHPSFGHWRRVKANTPMAATVDTVRRRFLLITSAVQP